MNIKVVTSFMWKFMERGSAQIISLVVQIILARMIEPEQFGALAILMVFINISNVFVQKGFSSSLIRKSEICDDDYNTAFVVSEIIAIIIVILLCTFSEYIEKFYGIFGLGDCLRVISVVLIAGALYSVQNAELVRKMKFKQIFVRSTIASVVSGVAGILAAYSGMGLWALVIQTVSQQVLICITTMFICEWKPKFRYSSKSFHSMFSFGSQILVAELISIGVENLRTLIIGKVYTSAQLAYYDRGQLYPATAMRNIYDALQNVLLPVFSKEQDNRKGLSNKVNLSILLANYITFPVFVGFAAIATPFVELFLTEKWLPCVPFLKIFCLYQIAFPLYGILKQCLFALGKGAEVLKLEVKRGIFFVIAIVLGVFVSVYTTAILSCVAMYLTTFNFIVVLNKEIQLDLKGIILQSIKMLVQCILMYIVVSLLIRQLDMSNIYLLIIGMLAGSLIYLLSSVFFRNKAFKVIVSWINLKK